MLLPDVLVLGSGGLLGEQWMNGVLAGIEDATGFDMRDCEQFLGTSAGSIVAAALAAGRSPRRPDTPPAAVEPAREPEASGPGAAALELARRVGEWTQIPLAPLAPLALAATAPGGRLVRAGVLTRVRSGARTLDDLRAEVEQYGARFDGRLRITAVDRRAGERVVFGKPGSPHATVAEAVAASCAVPWLFAPVTIAGREYVDGGMWSATNLDAAPAGRGTHVLCLNPTGATGGIRTLIAVARRLASSVVSVETLTLRQRGAIVRTIAPNLECAAAIGGDLMDPEPGPRVLAAGYRQGLAVAQAAPTVAGGAASGDRSA